jgi:hypothetical protein
MRIRSYFLAVTLLCAFHAFGGTGKFIILNTDAARVGFNDPTPVQPVGGNMGTTLGQQRLNVFMAAAEGWRKLIDTNVDIVASASFVSIIIPNQPCTETGGVLGQASPTNWMRDFAKAPLANVWYPIALANKFAGVDLLPSSAEIFVQFNLDVDNATCLGPSNWYYGFDGNEGTNVDLYTVVQHELGHGLGLAGAANAPDFLAGRPSVFDVHTLDRTLGLRWDQMTLEQRRVSMTNTGNLVWDGAGARDAAARFLGPNPTFTVLSPDAPAHEYQIGLASFGSDVSLHFVSGRIVPSVDEGPTTTDGCSPFTNAAAIAGTVALVDRGNCTFVTKALNAQAAGAIGLVIVDNSRASCAPIAPGGANSTITIPVVGILAADGDLLKVQIAANTSVAVTLAGDASRRAGTSTEGYVRLYAPCVVEPGSSVHHWDDVAHPNLLMEPAINGDLTHDGDFTLQWLMDLGWTSRQGRRFLTR